MRIVETVVPGHVNRQHAGLGGRIPRNQRWQTGHMGDAFAIIEAELEVPWVLGERYSVSDMFLFTLARWLEGDGVNPAQLPRITDHRTRMSQDPVVTRVLAAETAS